MELHLKHFLIFVSCMYCLNLFSCQSPAQGIGGASWTCVCAASPLGYQNSSPLANCSSSCHCLQDQTSGKGSWNCSCILPKNPETQASGNLHDENCFTACNCTSGTSQQGQKHVSNKIVIVALVVCVVLTTIAFLATAACYFHRKDKLCMQIHYIDKLSSWSSRMNLIHQSSPLPVSQPNLSSSSGILREFIRWFSLIFGNQKRSVPGVIVRFSYAELEQATNKFSNDNLVGVGGTCKVFRGQLSDGQLVAIKKLRTLRGAEEDYETLSNEFLSEIELLSRLNHCHVVPLIGYCSENQGRHSERLLVFEYMSNGNLRDCLDLKLGKPAMDWETRVNIALGAARGLEYLHEAAAPRILHRDIKSTNILLDEKDTAKITDLGMAKRLMNDGIGSASDSPARMMGTFGYFAPEYAIVGKASRKSDVFSFGVVILELITGRKAIHKSPHRGDESLVIWATARLRDSNLVVTELPDPLLEGKFHKEEMQIMAHLARECLQFDPESRPTMGEVVQILSTISPDKTKRRKLPTSLVMGSSYQANPISRLDQFFASSERWQSRIESPAVVDQEQGEDYRKSTGTVLSAEVVNGLILLSSHDSCWQCTDEEVVVDLTEPRLETFTQANAFR